MNTAKMTAEILASGLTQAEVAKYCGVSQPTVGRWVKGFDPEGPNRDKLFQLYDEVIRHNRPKPYSTFDPDSVESATDEAMTQGTETGLRGIPEGTSPQLDVTAGMGGGGITIISEGVRGESGMTFSAENIADYWRVPPAILSGMGGLKPTDITFVPCQGDSMAPTLIEGDVVVVDTRHRWPSPDGLYALTDDFGGIIVKRLHVTDEGLDGDRVVLIVSDNAKHEPRRTTVDDIRIVGRVLRKFGLVG